MEVFVEFIFMMGKVSDPSFFLRNLFYKISEFWGYSF